MAVGGWQAAVSIHHSPFTCHKCFNLEPGTPNLVLCRVADFLEAAGPVFVQLQGHLHAAKNRGRGALLGIFAAKGITYEKDN